MDESDYQTAYNKDEGNVTVSGINRGTEDNPVFTLADESMENAGELRSQELDISTKMDDKDMEFTAIWVVDHEQ